MSNQPEDEAGQSVERGASEEASDAPLTPTEEETSRRPAGVTPGVTPGSEEGPEAGSPEREELEREAAFKQRKELNPDDFE